MSPLSDFRFNSLIETNRMHGLTVDRTATVTAALLLCLLVLERLAARVLQVTVGLLAERSARAFLCVAKRRKNELEFASIALMIQ